jgi:hypothetical protein
MLLLQHKIASAKKLNATAFFCLHKSHTKWHFGTFSIVPEKSEAFGIL